MSEHALKATMKTMNVKPGGKSVTWMRDTEWEGKTQRLYTEDKDGKKIPKGMKQILKERKLWKTQENGRDIRQRDMIEILSKCEDFQNEKCILQKMVEARGHLWVPLPKFHCELSAMESMWMRMKLWTRRMCGYNLPSLLKNIPNAKATYDVDYIRKAFLRVFAYEKAYMMNLSTMDVFKKVKK